MAATESVRIANISADGREDSTMLVLEIFAATDFAYQLKTVFAAYTALLLIGLVGNVATFTCGVISTVPFSHHQLTMGNALYYLIAKASTDFAMTLCAPLTLAELLTSDWLYGTLACRLYVGIERQCVALSAWLLLAAVVERLHRVDLTTKLAVDTRRRRPALVGVLVGCALAALLLTAPWVYHARTAAGPPRHLERSRYFFSPNSSHSRMTAFGPRQRCLIDSMTAEDRGWLLAASAVLTFILPSLYLAYATAQLLRHTWIASHQMQKAPENCDDSLQLVVYNYCRINRRLCLLVLFHGLCWTPYWLLNLYGSVYRQTTAGSILAEHAVQLLPHVNCSLNWIFYAMFCNEQQASETDLVEQTANCALPKIQLESATVPSQSRSQLQAPAPSRQGSTLQMQSLLGRRHMKLRCNNCGISFTADHVTATTATRSSDNISPFLSRTRFQTFAGSGFRRSKEPENMV